MDGMEWQGFQPSIYTSHVSVVPSHEHWNHPLYFNPSSLLHAFPNEPLASFVPQTSLFTVQGAQTSSFLANNTPDIVELASHSSFVPSAVLSPRGTSDSCAATMAVDTVQAESSKGEVVKENFTPTRTKRMRKLYECPYALRGECAGQTIFVRSNCLQRHIYTFHEPEKAPYHCCWCGRAEVRKDHAASHEAKCLASVLSSGIPKGHKPPCGRRRRRTERDVI